MRHSHIATLVFIAVYTLTGLTGSAAPHIAASQASPGAASTAASSRAHPIIPIPVVVSYVTPSATTLAALPAATYSAVIPGLVPYVQSSVPVVPAAYTISSDSALYGPDRSTPIARLTAKNFLGQDTVVVPVQVDGDWALVLTPSRQELPSVASGNAPAQTAAWIRTSTLTKGAELNDRIQVSVSAQTLTILDGNGTPVRQFPVGVGAPGTETPSGVTGYLQARYLDPAQGQALHPIQLTSLHSAAQDNPYGGTDGGLIGVHYEQVANGRVSHGCVRLHADAIGVINTLPLGTLISIVN